MMEPAIIESVSGLIRQGDTSEALQLLLPALKKSGKHADALRTLQVVEASFNAVRQQELKGILTFTEAKQEYARTNNAILTVLDQVQNGSTDSKQLSTPQTRRVWYAGGGILLLVGLGMGLWFAQQKEAIGAPPTAEDLSVTCPVFRENNLKVMILEFQKLSGPESNPALGIQTRIRELTSNNQMNTDVKILQQKQFNNITLDVIEATELGKNCQVDLVVWGQYEQSNDSLILDVRYTFTNPKWPPGASIQTIKNVSEIRTARMQISKLDDAVFRLCTVLALHENRLDLAAKWMDKIEKRTPQEAEWRKALEGEEL